MEGGNGGSLPSGGRRMRPVTRESSRRREEVPLAEDVTPEVEMEVEDAPAPDLEVAAIAQEQEMKMFGIRACTMAPRRRPREEVAEQATRQEAGDAPPPQQTQPLPQDAHSGIVPPPPPPPPQVAQGLDLTRFLEGMAQFVAQHRDAPVPQGGTGKVLREFLQFQPPQFLGQPDPDIARAWLDAVERTFRSMECVPEERVLLASYQLQAQALTWWSSEWETTFQSRPLRQIPWQEFVVSFERAFCPTYARTERLYQFLDLQ
ncbi:hypothetical protein Taro_042088 [Colocasia esculenta]|uniref:Retrotransposon gag domain-containing protein n=1 Tax=Colocasia esculenta TaxID=4460 RepID=A0A843WVH8_COLES|nr:hypothetical protein [Colocasia esculenta]